MIADNPPKLHPPKPPIDFPPSKPTQSAARRLPAASLLALIVSAFLTSVFWYQARYNDSFQNYSYAWTAHWIASPYDSSTACFRKVITVDGPVRSAYVVLAADNFYQLRVNGVIPSKRYVDGKAPTLLSRQTTYSETGYGRRDLLGNVYDIGALLLPGRNVISVVVQSDEPQQRLLLQGEYMDSMHHDLASDSSWRCSPSEQVHGGMPWYLAQYPDSDWPQARSLPQPADIPANLPVDGDASLIATPIQGYFISAAHPSSNATTLLRRTIHCPGTVTQGWIRLNWWCPYDLSINGEVIGSTSDVNRYNLSPLARRLEWDTLRRMQGSGGVSYSSGAAANNTDIYLVRSIMHRGDNEIEITLHNENFLGEKPVQAINLNAEFLHDTGARQLIVTDNQWQVFDAASRQWLPATEAYTPSALNSGHGRTDIRDWVSPAAWHLGRIARNGILLLLLFAAAGWIVERFRPASRAAPAGPRGLASRIGLTFVAPAGILGVALISLAIFSQSAQTQFVGQPSYAAAVLLLAAASWLISAALSLLPDRTIPATRTDLRPRIIRFADRYGFAIAQGLIVLLTALYSFARLDASDFLPDEYVSMLASRGILRHGIPIYESTHIIYTRSSLYHYLLALFMWVGGSTTNAYVTRSLAGCWQVATVILVYFFGRDVKNRWTGLIAAAMVGLSPFMIFYAREARFYTQFTFFSTLCFYYLWKSVQEPGNARHKVAMGLAYIGGYLSQELMITVLPAIAVVVFLAGQTRQYLRGAGLAIMLAMGLVMGLDYAAYAKFCQTPLPFVDSDSMLLLAFHVDGLDLVPSMLLISNERSEMAVGGLYVLGLLYLLGRTFAGRKDDSEPQAPWRWSNYLYLVSVLVIVTTTLFTPRPTPRYVINSVPLVALAAAAVAEEIVRRLQAGVSRASGSRRSGQWVGGLFALTLSLLCLLAFRPLRVWNNTQRKDSMSTTACALYVKNHLQPGDKVFFCSPEFAMMEIGRCDYFWRINPSSIYTYEDQDGVLRERNSGAVAVNSIDKMRDVITQNPRVWLVVPNLSESPKAIDSESFRMDRFVQANCRLMDQGLDDNVYLWDRSRNHYADQYRATSEDSLNFSLN